MIYRLAWALIILTALGGYAWAQAVSEGWLELEVCRIDYSGIPLEAQGTGRIIHFYYPAELPIAIEALQTVGEECSKIWGSKMSINVVGSVPELKKKFGHQEQP